MFVDTSALYGLLDADDPAHSRLAAALEELDESSLVTHNYVVIESVALVGRRLGTPFVRHLLLDALSAVEVHWIDESTHRGAASAFLGSRAVRPSLVDFTSFEVMRLHGIRTALAVDRDFVDAGFDVLPA